MGDKGFYGTFFFSEDATKELTRVARAGLRNKEIRGETRVSVNGDGSTMLLTVENTFSSKMGGAVTESVQLVAIQHGYTDQESRPFDFEFRNSGARPALMAVLDAIKNNTIGVMGFYDNMFGDHPARASIDAAGFRVQQIDIGQSGFEHFTSVPRYRLTNAYNGYGNRFRRTLTGTDFNTTELEYRSL